MSHCGSHQFHPTEGAIDEDGTEGAKDVAASGTALVRRAFLGLVAVGAAVGLTESAASAGGPRHDATRIASTPRSSHGSGQAKARSLVFVWLNGGPSHIDTFDPKPKARSAGLFRAMKTSLAGVQFCEHLPELAAEAKRLTVIRGIKSREGNHDRARHYARTGYAPNPTASHPAFGAWVSEARSRPGSALPAYVSLGGPGSGPGILGAEHAPLVVRRAGAPPDSATSAAPVSEVRAARRRALLDAMEAEFEARSPDPVSAARAAVAREAERLARSGGLAVFDVADEPTSVLDAYGDSDFGRGCVVARRLVERGVPFVEITLDGWDVHEDAFERQRPLLDRLDRGLSALLRDLAARSLLDSTLILCMGEFGRSPRINAREGRDHHPNAFSALLAGGGTRPGVFGTTDESGQEVVADALSVPDLYATCALLLGIDPARARQSPSGRPLRITDGGRPVAALLA